MPLHRNASRPRTFNLVRHFFLLSLILMMFATGTMAAYLWRLYGDQLLKLETGRALSLVQVFENSLWPRFRPMIDAPGNADALRALADQSDLRTAVIQLMEGTDVIKLKVYALDGRTVFSTDPSQVGEDKSGNSGFRAAASGQAVSDLTHRNSFDAFEGRLEKRDVISTYVPVHGAGERIEGVLELYVDATPFVSSSSRQLRWLVLVISVLMVCLYFAQLLVVRRAGGILDSQAAQLEEANRELDSRVEERTRALAESNAQLQDEIKERRGVEDRLDRLAHHDPLTGLPNRLMFIEHLRQSLSHSMRYDRSLAVLFIDLDRFKDVNDTLGHFTGDQLLKAVATRLSSRVRQSDTLARLGGDEFVCILEEVSDEAAASLIADSLLALFSTPFSIAGNDLYLSASIGISLSPRDGNDVETLVRNADIAMYQAKAAGRNRSQFYTREMSVAAEQRMGIESGLRLAIESEEIAVHFQPKVDSETGRLVGAEALARWTHVQLGEVSPVKFIPIAEDSGLIVSLGEQVLEKSCRQFVQWREAGHALPELSVNVSVKQLERAGFVERLRTILADTGMPPACLELEITESVIMAVDDVFAILDALHELGVGLAIDDFGTGYSSLAYLKRLPIQVLKIDRAFILGIGSSAGDEAIVKTIIALATSLGLSTVAEGVEAESQVRFLGEAGCRTIQGYYYCRPLPGPAFASAWLARSLPAAPLSDVLSGASPTGIEVA